MLGVTILGNNSAVPAFDRHPTSQVLSLSNRKFLIDCGEGTQIQMIKYKIRRSQISHIFISHLHGDHYFGLIGLISSFALLGRQQELHIFGPEPLKEIIELQLKHAATHICYDLHIHAVTEPGTLLELDDVKVTCFKTDHRIECYGFVFEEKKKPRRVNIANANQHGVPLSFMEALRDGKDFIDENGELIKNEELTNPNRPSKKYAFCADTRYNEDMLTHIKDADMIYHETTYLSVFDDKAFERFHSTTTQTGQIAKKSGTKRLLIGHFSSKYDVLDEFLAETTAVFPNTELAIEGVSYRI